MTREEAIEYAEDKFSKGLYRLDLGYLNRGLYQIVSREVEFLRVAIAALREQESAKNAHCNCCKNGNSWISVEEQLPEPNVLVLVVFVRHGQIKRRGFGTLQQHGVWYVSNEGMPPVTHWMPLPQPPEEEVC